MQRLYSSLAIVLVTAVGAAEVRAEGPVVLDAWNRYQTRVQAARKVQKGWPWGWFPRVNLYVLKSGMERDDIVTVQHYRGKRKWGKPDKCRLRMIWDKKLGVGHFECRGLEDMAINKGGSYGVEVTYKAVGADKIYKKIAFFKYKVTKFKIDNRHIKRRFKPSPGFVVDHDFRVGEAWLAEVDKGATEPTYLRLRTWFKYNKAPNRPKVRCYLDGKKVAESGPTRKQESIEYRYYTKKNTQAPAVIWAKHYWHFYKFATIPPRKTVSSVSYPGVFYLSKNPGKYVCRATADGDKIATFHFEVGKDGKIVHPACQSQTDTKQINTLDSTHLIKVVYGKGANIKYDKRAFAKSPMYGQKWPKGCPLR